MLKIVYIKTNYKRKIIDIKYTNVLQMALYSFERIYQFIAS